MNDQLRMAAGRRVVETVEAIVQVSVAAIGAIAPIAVAKINARKARTRVDQGGKAMESRKNPFALLVASVIGALITLGLLNGGLALAHSVVIHAPTPIEGLYFPSGRMGDGENVTSLQLTDQWTEKTHSTPTCVRVSYQKGPPGWAGVYWQSPDGNWGDKPGRRIDGATKVSFWARGENGGELVAFKAGGIHTEGKKYQDSFERTLGTVKLSAEWQQFVIPLAGADTSSVLGAFAWSASSDGNPSPLVFFIDDISYER
jgi:hypothetical protein